MRILVTGATGFVGRYLIRKLVERHHLFCLVRRREQILTRMGKFILIKGDLSQPLDIHSLPSKLDVIIHLAQARVPFPEQANEFFRGSIGSTQELLEYGRCVGIKRFIYASSGGIYGFGPRPFSENDPPRLLNFYAVSKYCSELLIRAYSSYFCTCILRLFFPYGPSQVSRRIPMIAERVIQGHSVSLINNGEPRINPIYIDDLVQVIELALELNKSVAVNVAGDEVIDMKELAELVGKLTGRQPAFENIIDPSMSDLVGNNELMHRLFPLESLTSIQKGFKTTIECMLPTQGNL